MHRFLRGQRGYALHSVLATERAGAARALGQLLAAWLLPFFSLANLYCLYLTIGLCPGTLDAQLFAADATLGVQPSVVVAGWFAHLPPLKVVAYLVYQLLPLAYIVVFLAEVRLPRQPAVDAFSVAVPLAVVGYAIYLLFPVVGPVYYFGDDFPGSLPSAAAALAAPPVAPEISRNCMPSLHTAWALALWWQARSLGRRAASRRGSSSSSPCWRLSGLACITPSIWSWPFPSPLPCEPPACRPRRARFSAGGASS